MSNGEHVSDARTFTNSMLVFVFFAVLFAVILGGFIGSGIKDNEPRKSVGKTVGNTAAHLPTPYNLMPDFYTNSNGMIVLDNGQVIHFWRK